MGKSVFWGLRVSEQLHEQVQAEKDKRGMNLSEFVRYAVSVFFDVTDDGKPHNGDRNPVHVEDRFTVGKYDGTFPPKVRGRAMVVLSCGHMVLADDLTDECPTCGRTLEPANV